MRALYDAEAATHDCRDGLAGLERLMAPGTSLRLSELLTAAQDLSRASTSAVGHAPLPDLDFDPRICAPRPLAVALMTACMNGLASELGRVESTGSINTDVHTRGSAIAVTLSAGGFTAAAAERLAGELGTRLGQDPAVSIGHTDRGLEVVFRVLQA